MIQIKATARLKATQVKAAKPKSEVAVPPGAKAPAKKTARPPGADPKKKAALKKGLKAE